MIKSRILQVLREKGETLKQYHVRALYLFGSVAREEELPQSDVDILVLFDSEPTFDQYMELKFYLEELFQRKVDLVTEAGLRPEIRKYVDKERIRAAKNSNAYQHS